MNFEYTIRALNEEVKAIPAVEISYFDSIKGEYSRLISNSIPIQVEENRQVTLMDVEGNSNQSYFNLEVTSNLTGISHNYTGDELLEKHASNVLELIKSPIKQFLIFLGPLSLILAIVFSGLVKLRKIYSSKKIRAIDLFKKSCNRISTRKLPNGDEVVLEIVRDYLANRLNLSKSPNTYEDVDIHLKNAHTSTGLCQELREFFIHYEKIRYSGKQIVAITPLENVISMIERIDRSLIT